MSDSDPLIQAISIQGRACAAMGSAFSGGLLERAAADVAAGGPMSALFAPWRAASARDLMTDAVPLRLLGALHDLALSGDWPALTAAYPADGGTGDPEAAWSAAADALPIHAAALADFMRHEPQTNEVRRSACLAAGFVAVTARTGLPLRCFELGASAGLNQFWDAWRYDFGAAGGWGPADAPVVIDAQWRGAPPPSASPRVIERAACDRKPVDLTDPRARRRLRAYVWADQHDRLARLDGAVAVALARGARVEAEDAVTWTARRAAPAPGALTVVYHSVFWQYLPADSQTALAAAIAAHGASATPAAPFAWLRMEPVPSNMADMRLKLTLWPGGEEAELAAVHPHGAWIDWA